MRLKNTPRWVCWLAVVCVVSCGLGCGGGGVERKTFKANAENLKQTVVTAHLREPHASGKSLVWCASMQMAWDEAAGHFGGTMPLEGAPLMGTALDEHLVGKQDLDAEAYVALAGFRVDGIREKIPAAVREKFGSAMPAPVLPETGRTPEDADIIAYACLLKNMEFAEPFLRWKDTPMRFGPANVASFGLWPGADTRNHSEISRQVLVWQYDQGEFIVELQSKAVQDHLVLACVAPGATLNDTVAKVLAVTGSGQPRDQMRGSDTFLAPAMDFDLLRNYGEIVGKKLTVDCVDSRFKGKYAYFEIAAAQQGIQFKLDEHGAILKSEATMEMKAVTAAPSQPRMFVFDKPFLILIRHEGAKMPYFAFWVDNAELLQAAK